MRFPGFKTLVFVLAAVALIAGNVCAADKPIKSMADVAGEGTGTAQLAHGRTEKITSTIGEDGNFSASGWTLDTAGRMQLAGDKLIWKGSRGATGIATLTEDDELAVSVTGGQGFVLPRRGKK